MSASIPDLTDLSLGYSDLSEALQAVIAWYPPVDFSTMDGQLACLGNAPDSRFAHGAENSPESIFLGCKVSEFPEIVAKANPETYIRPGFPHFFIQHGTDDGTVPFLQSLQFARKLDQAASGSVSYVLILNARHADPAFETERNIAKVLRFIAESFAH